MRIIAGKNCQQIVNELVFRLCIHFDILALKLLHSMIHNLNATLDDHGASLSSSVKKCDEAKLMHVPRSMQLQLVVWACSKRFLDCSWFPATIFERRKNNFLSFLHTLNENDRILAPEMATLSWSSWTASREMTDDSVFKLWSACSPRRLSYGYRDWGKGKFSIKISCVFSFGHSYHNLLHHSMSRSSHEYGTVLHCKKKETIELQRHQNLLLFFFLPASAALRGFSSQ